MDKKIINDRYSILNKLGQGGSSITYAATDNKTNQLVAIKALSLTGLEDWKKIELFEREAKILQQLNHPAIPKYIDYFKIETEDNIYFYIVQQLAPGQSLAQLISHGWIPEENTVKDIAEKILEILVYLQQLTPSVIHRDIKPQNIIYQPDTGKLFLVDFGAVQDTYHHTVMGSTVVGTYGYMAPEQFRGGAILSTDLYGLGCTLLFLLTGKPPIDLPQKKIKIIFRNIVKLERNFANWIDKLIEPNIDRRFPKAEAALLVLQLKKPRSDYEIEIATKPRYSSIKINRTAEELTIDIPPPWKRKRVDRIYYFWLAWGIISILNRLAIFVSTAWLGKIYVLLWFSNILFTKDKELASIAIKVLFLLFLSVIWFDSNLYLPSFSIVLILVDALLNLILEHNFIEQLLIKTSVKFNSKSDKIYLSQQIFNFKDKPDLKYNSGYFRLPKAFLTIPERHWLLTEIDRYYRK